MKVDQINKNEPDEKWPPSPDTRGSASENTGENELRKISVEIKSYLP